LAELEVISDSEYGVDQERRISGFGWNLYFCEALIFCKSKASNSVTLSSTEAEYIALSEVTKEIMLIKQVLETMGIGLKSPITVKIDNVGAIYLSNNHSLGQRTKLIDIRRHFVRELVEQGIIKTAFVGTDNNDAEIRTNNTPEETFKRHVNKHLVDIRQIMN
jgi:hypothetical protein